MNLLPPAFQLPQDLWKQMEADVASKSPEEACGFVIGKGNIAVSVLPVTNILHDPFRFRMDPQEELAALLLAEDTGQEILAIYHSHPGGIDHPSISDINELAFPGIIYLIWFQKSSDWRCRAFEMKSNSNPIEISVITSLNLER